MQIFKKIFQNLPFHIDVGHVRLHVVGEILAPFGLHQIDAGDLVSPFLPGGSALIGIGQALRAEVFVLQDHPVHKKLLEYEVQVVVVLQLLMAFRFENRPVDPPDRTGTPLEGKLTVVVPGADGGVCGPEPSSRQ